jgi:hypothetical protein
MNRNLSSVQHHVHFCAADISLLNIIINIKIKTRETILNVSSEVCLEINTEKAKYMFTVIAIMEDIIMCS